MNLFRILRSFSILPLFDLSQNLTQCPDPLLLTSYPGRYLRNMKPNPWDSRYDSLFPLCHLVRPVSDFRLSRNLVEFKVFKPNTTKFWRTVSFEFRNNLKHITIGSWLWNIEKKHYRSWVIFDPLLSWVIFGPLTFCPLFCFLWNWIFLCLVHRWVAVWRQWGFMGTGQRDISWEVWWDHHVRIFGH